MERKKTSLTYRVIRWLVWLFSPKYRLCGTENLPDGPCVIAGNHCHMYGPIASELYTPGPHDTWCAAEMMHRKEVADYAFRDFWSKKPKSVLWFYRILSHLIVPLSVCVFNNADTIGVYHDSRVMTTFRETLDRLQNGRRVVIFPEHYVPHNNIITHFQDRFIDLGRLYWKRTGQTLSFVPMYLAPMRKEMHFGEPVPFRPDCSAAEERKRICGLLMDRITEIAVSLPEHTVIPYPNLPKSEYRKNVPLEVDSIEKTVG